MHATRVHYNIIYNIRAKRAIKALKGNKVVQAFWAFKPF